MTTGTSGAQTGHAGIMQTFRDLPVAARIVLVGVFVNQFGAFLQLFLILYLVDGRGFTNQQAGVALGAYSIGALIGTLFGGGLSDRLGPRWTIVTSVGTAALFTLSVTALSSFTAILVAVALAGAMTQSARPAVSALLFSLVPEARQVMIFAMYRTALNTGAVAGPLVAVWLSTVNWDLVFWFDAATALAYCAIAAFLLPPDRLASDRARPAADEEASPAGQEASPAGGTGAAAGAPGGVTRSKAGYLTLLRDYRYLAYLALMLGNGLVHVQFFVVLPLMLRDDGYANWAYGTATAVTAFLVISCELLVTRTTQTWPAWVAIMAGWVLLIVGRGGYGLPGGIAIVLAATILATIGQIIGGPSAFAYPAKVAPAGAMGRYIGSAHAMFQLGYVIGPIVGVLLWNGLDKAFWALVFVFGLAMIPIGLWGIKPALADPPAGALADPPAGADQPARADPPAGADQVKEGNS